VPPEKAASEQIQAAFVVFAGQIFIFDVL